MALPLHQQLINAAKKTAALAHPRADIRRKAAHFWLKRAAQLQRTRLYNADVDWFNRPHLKQLGQDFSTVVGQTVEYGDRHFTLHQLALSCANLPGDTVECGTFDGRGSHMIMVATQRTGRVHHIFDSFAGLSEPDEVDTAIAAEFTTWQEGDLAVDEVTVKNNLAAHDGGFELYKGWIPDRFQDVTDKKFAFVHIDVDLYQPTLDSAKFFYERMVPGGMIVCDDYAYRTCPGARKGMDEAVENKPERVIELPTGQGLIVKQP